MKVKPDCNNCKCSLKDTLIQYRDHFNDKLKAKLKRRCTKKVTLTTNDFRTGPYIISEPGYYKLETNLSFGPNPENDYRPYPTDNYSQNFPLAFHLGFFAAIVINCSNVIIDLNDKVIEASYEFYIMQRFYANIELNITPFMPGQGPGNFGPIQKIKNIWIKNGTLGLSSHHGLHGNNIKNLLVENVIATQFEVAGFATNSIGQIYYKNCSALNNLQNVPVNELWSNALFLRQYLEQFPELAVEATRLNNLVTAVKNELFTYQTIFNEEGKLFSNSTDDKSVSNVSPSDGLINSETTNLKLPIGNSYGFLNHMNTGVAVNEFDNGIQHRNCSQYFYMSKCKIQNLKSAGSEIISLSTPDGLTSQMDAAGAVLNIELITDEQGYYKYNIVADSQIRLAEVVLSKGLKLSKLNISQDVVNWRNSKMIPYLKPLTLQEAVFSQNPNYKYICGTDVMMHLAKPVIGLRLDATDNVLIDNLEIVEIENRARLGSDKYLGNYRFGSALAKRPFFRGTQLSAIHLSNIYNFVLTNFKISGLTSYNGHVNAINSIYGSTNNLLDNGYIDNLTTGVLYKDNTWYGYDHDGQLVKFTVDGPNPLPFASAIDIEDANCQLDYKNIHIGNEIKGLLSAKVLRGNYVS